MMKLLHSSNAKIILRFVLVISLVLAVVSLAGLASFYYRAESQAKTRARQVTHDAAVMIEGKLKEIEAVINEFSAVSASRGIIPDPEMKSILEKGLKSNKALFGIVIAYAPYRYSPRERLHSIYATIKNNRVDFTAVERTYDYTATGNEWYHRPVSEGAVWSKPFWGKASNAMVVTYSVPVTKKLADGSTAHIATISAVCSLNNLNEMVSSLDLGRSGYGFITDKDGTFIAHPAQQLILEKVTLPGYARKHYGKRNQDIIEEGVRDFAPLLYQEPTKLTKQMGVMSMEPVRSVGWFVGSALVKAELGFSKNDAKRRWSYCILTLTLLICFYVLYRIQADEPEYWMRNLPKSAVILTATFTAGLLAIWGMEIALGFPSPYEDPGFVSDKGSLSKFIQSRKKTAAEHHEISQQFIPTGILLNSLKLSGVGDIEVSGTFWHKRPKEVAGQTDAAIRYGVYLPTASKLTMTEAYRSESADVTVIGMNFTAGLAQHFDNTLYPFDRQQIRIPLRQKQMLDQVQLVPDFPSYSVYVPTANPFVRKDLFVPGWRVKQTYFTFEKCEQPTTFGYDAGSPLNDAHDLVLNITLQREIIASFISIFLPLIMLAIIMYIALLLSTGDEKKVSILWFRPANMQVVSGSFLLYLVFSTINLRNHILSDKILYVEYMFFFMYFVIFGLIVASIKITLKNEESILGCRDGYFVKSMYWPLVTGSMFIITAAVFF